MIVTVSFGAASGARRAYINISGATGYTGYEFAIATRDTTIDGDNVQTGSLTNGGITGQILSESYKNAFLFLTAGEFKTLLYTQLIWISDTNVTYFVGHYSQNQLTSARVDYSRNDPISVPLEFFVPDPPVSAIDLSLQNNSTVQQIKYKVGAGAETTLNAGASAQISNLGNGAVLGVNPILSARPITFNSNGRIASVGYNGVNYTQFPTNINVDVSGTPSIMLNGTQAPTVTVNYSNTNEPVITNT